MVIWGDFRSVRRKLRPEDFVFPGEGGDPAAVDLTDRKTWRGLIALPDHVSLRTSELYGATLGIAWDLLGEWTSLGLTLQEEGKAGPTSPIADAALNAGDYFNGSVFNALTGFYRLGYSSLRAVVENITAGAACELGCMPVSFEQYLAGDDDLRFGFRDAASHIVNDAGVASLERALRTATGDDLYRQKNGTDQGGLARRLFVLLSKYAHGAPLHTDVDLRHGSNGPIFAHEVFAEWAECFSTVFALSVLLCRLAQPRLEALWDSDLDAALLFERAVSQLPAKSDARRLFNAVPAEVW